MWPAKWTAGWIAEASIRKAFSRMGGSSSKTEEKKKESMTNLQVNNNQGGDVEASSLDSFSYHGETLGMAVLVVVIMAVVAVLGYLAFRYLRKRGTLRNRPVLPTWERRSFRPVRWERRQLQGIPELNHQNQANPELDIGELIERFSTLEAAMSAASGRGASGRGESSKSRLHHEMN